MIQRKFGQISAEEVSLTPPTPAKLSSKFMARPRRSLRDEVVPDIYIVGVPKAATTSLAEAIVATKNVSFGSSKEPAILTSNYPLEIRRSFYRKHYKSDNMKAVRLLDASPWYGYNPEISGLILEMSGTLATTIVTLRQPIERMVSMYNDQFRRGREKRTFENCLREELLRPVLRESVRTTDYVACSLYSKVILNLTRTKELSPPLVVFYEELRKDFSQELKWLGTKLDLALDVGQLPHSNPGIPTRILGQAALDRLASVGRGAPLGIRRFLRTPGLKLSRHLRDYSPRQKIQVPQIRVSDNALLSDIDDLIRSDLQASERLLAHCQTRPGAIASWMANYRPSGEILQPASGE